MSRWKPGPATLVYLQTIYRLHAAYGFTKFIVLVPSIAIKEGVLSTFDAFGDELADRFGSAAEYFEYDSKKPIKLRQFIEGEALQVMIMTVQTLASDDRIINQVGRDDAVLGANSHAAALGQCEPVVIMDEPQEGMDTTNAIARIGQIKPLCRLRYSATHKIVRNLVFRLSPADAYNQGIVKKLEVLSVTERNAEATLKLEIAEVRTESNREPRVKLRAWRQRFKWRETTWMRAGDRLLDRTNNVSYDGFTVERIWRGLLEPHFKVRFTNGAELLEGQRAGDIEGLFRKQLYWLIRRHLGKKAKLKPLGIKCLSLVFIDRVDNYMRADGIIRIAFQQEYSRVCAEVLGRTPTPTEVSEAQGYYFARTASGDLTDSEAAMSKNREIYDLILNDKKTLLSLENPVEFIFSHSALGVGWDNPNVFNIATLNHSFSDDKKRQEMGRGLRICVDQEGRRRPDDSATPEGEEINILTVVPNESYETFAAQYHDHIRRAYGTEAAGSTLRQSKNGVPVITKVRRVAERFESEAFRNLWDVISQKTTFSVAFEEAQLITRAIEALNTIAVPHYEAEIVLRRVTGFADAGVSASEVGRELERLKASYSPVDPVKFLSDATSLSHRAVGAVLTQISSHEDLARNPYRFLQEAARRIRRLQLEEMVRVVSYQVVPERYSPDNIREMIETYRPTQDTPQRGIYDKAICDSGSEPERRFAMNADMDTEVVCFLKLPDFYVIRTPMGPYRPDFGLVLHRRALADSNGQEYYFVIETKSTNNIDDIHALTESERYKMLCAIKHFQALGVQTQIAYSLYRAPVADYQQDFKSGI